MLQEGVKNLRAQAQTEANEKEISHYYGYIRVPYGDGDFEIKSYVFAKHEKDFYSAVTILGLVDPERIKK